MRKIFTLLLALLSVLPIWALPFLAADGSMYYDNLGDSKAAVYGKLSGTVYSGDIIIPSKVTDKDGNSYTVTEIAGYAFENCKALTSISIPSSVTKIGSNAFLNCIGLSAVYISDLTAWCGITFENLSANPLENAHNLY